MHILPCLHHSHIKINNNGSHEHWNWGFFHRNTLQISDDIDIGMKYPDFLEPNKVQIQSNLTPYNLFSFSCSYCMVLLVVGKQCWWTKLHQSLNWKKLKSMAAPFSRNIWENLSNKLKMYVCCHTQALRISILTIWLF